MKHNLIFVNVCTIIYIQQFHLLFFKTLDFISEIFDSSPMTPINQIALNLSVKTVSETGDAVFALLSSHVRPVGVIQQNKMCEKPGNSSGCDSRSPPLHRHDTASTRWPHNNHFLFFSELLTCRKLFFWSTFVYYFLFFLCVWLWDGKGVCN